MRPDAPRRPERSLTLPERYRLRRHIATGGMASVWCADDLVLDRSVAIKVLAERFAHDGLAVARFKREARAAARVSGHSHVVTVYDVGELPEPAQPLPDATHGTGRAFIVMEYLAGGTVADAIRHDSVRRHEAMRWLREAASALDHAHANGIVHRDIKPANFLLDRSRVLHVADFGIARLMTEDTITTSDQLFGTAAYLSPEQALGREATGASDRYALAVCAFELLAGERPFSAPHFSAQARQHIEEPPPAASGIDHSLPAAVDDVLFTALSKDPDARPRTAGEFVATLTDALSGRAQPARPPAGRRRGGAGARTAPDPAAPAASTAAARRRQDTRAPTTRPPQDGQGGTGRSRLVALGALAVAALILAGVAVATTLGGHRSGSRIADATTGTPTVTRTTTAATPVRSVRRHPRVSARTTTSAQTPEELQSTGHQELLEGDYGTAIDTLQQAVSTAPHDTLTYAYALYDLGHAELLNGDPQAAIQVLKQRLAIPNQRGSVKELLNEALAAAGDGNVATSTSSATTPTTPTTPTTGAGTSGSGGGGLGATSGATGPQGNAQIASLRRHRSSHRSPITIITAAAAG